MYVTCSLLYALFFSVSSVGDLALAVLLQVRETGAELVSLELLPRVVLFVLGLRHGGERVDAVRELLNMAAPYSAGQLRAFLDEVALLSAPGRWLLNRRV